MGYTLVTAFDLSFSKKMGDILENHKANKIPFGRNCDRISANRNMSYHMTLIHWAKEYDSVYLPYVEQLRFEPFEIMITGTQMLYAEEGSLLLYFSVMPGKNYSNAMNQIEQIMKREVSYFLHITIAVSKERTYIQNLKRIIDERFRYPFCLKITELHLYHIWKPVALARTIHASL